ncbi:unnamed protein product, partial [Prorocentrum cordatum]
MNVMNVFDPMGHDGRFPVPGPVEAERSQRPADPLRLVSPSNGGAPGSGPGLRGTIGYADPLYIRTGHVTERSEVYSFGMVLLETLTRRPPALQHANGRIEYQFSHLDGELANVRAMVDKRGEWPPQLADEVGSLALRCTHKQEARALAACLCRRTASRLKTPRPALRHVRNGFG